MATDVTHRLAAALERIIDDHLLVTVLLERDPQAWAEAVEALGEFEGYEPEPQTAVASEQP